MSHPLAGLMTLMWHYVGDPDPQLTVGATRVDSEAFNRQLDVLGRSRTIVGWPDVADALAGKRSIPSGACLLTFDDGLLDHHRTVAPVLAARGWPAVFFVLARTPRDGLALGHRIHVLLGCFTAANLRDAVAERLPGPSVNRMVAVEQRYRDAGHAPIDVLKLTLQRELADEAGPILADLVARHLGAEADVAAALYLDDQQVRDLRSSGFAIGGHGRDHLWLDCEPRARARAEVHAAARLVRGLDDGPSAFAYPYGGTTRGAARLLSANGFMAAFVAGPSAPRGRYDLGRLDAETLDLAAIGIPRASARGVVR